MKVFTVLGLVGALTAVILTPKSSFSQLPPSTVFPSPTATPLPVTPSLPNSPKRLTIIVSVAQPDDLKVKENQHIKAGDLIADRGRERTRLEAQKSQLRLTLHRLKTATITQPLPPAPVPTIASLPPASYLEQEAAVEQAKATVEQAESAIQFKQQEIGYLSELENLAPLVREHSSAQLAKLQQQHTAAVRAYQLAMGKLNTAHTDQQYQQYRHSIDKAQRSEAQNQVALEFLHVTIKAFCSSGGDEDQPT